MHHLLRILVASFALAAFAGSASAQCPPDCPVKGGGDAATDCHVELASDAVRVNYPPFNPSRPKPGKEIRCFDGDPGCDLDGEANNSCTFDIDLCLRNADPSLPSCTPADVTAVAIKGKGGAIVALQAAVDALLPATMNTCTTGQSVVVPLKGPNSKGEFKPGKIQFKLSATAGSVDSDSFRMVCVPRGWPSHSYDANNTRATPLETKIDAGNVAGLVEKWRFTVPAGLGRRTVSSTVTVGAKLVYTSAWNGYVYAVDKKKGKVKWTFHTSAQYGGGTQGVQSSVTLVADGRVLVANSDGELYCLDGKKGTLLWSANAGSEDPLAAHAWGSPTVVNNRVLIGIASHNDAPCVRGTLVAYDLDDGTELWRQYTVPERICYDDTNVECASDGDCALPGSPCLLARCDSNPNTPCSTNGDCPATFLTPGTCVAPAPAATGECWLERSVSCTTDADCPACVPGKGGGVTTTPAASPDGNSIYSASVGCLSFPSIGNSDSLFKLDAATGAVQWVYRTEAPEQFQTFMGGPTYHDYGFLNGPILADVDDGMSGTTPVAVAGGKDGTLYAVHQDTGLLEWSNVLAAAPSFAGFGLFNGALAYEPATDQFFAALYSLTGYSGPRLMGFTGLDGTTSWTDPAAPQSWSSVTVANGLLLTGNLSNSALRVHDTTSGALLVSLPVPSGSVLGGAAVENGVIYIPYGDVFGGMSAPGGIVAYTLPAAP